ncbi:hypothetical protein ACFS5N_16450 [Mucilaginibacter ximonensis]|uniref:AAA+ ATPase domain-containing protein n=1 Tax=Mucilaginibacter ximonensis TaxID=538021 RepID=A0ABW5YFK4_9SPHI
MRRAKTIKNLFDKKHQEFEFDGIWKDRCGNPDRAGAWLIWGPEKNGKTWITMLAAKYLSQFEKVHYVSAEEGTGKDFVASLKRAKISASDTQIQVEEYEALEDLKERLKKRKAPRIVIIDNLTCYRAELKPSQVQPLLREFPEVLFIFLAHEERGEPYTALAREVRKLAKIIIRVEGLACHVSGRCPGGMIMIDESRSLLYHGQDIMNKTA